MKQFRLAVAAAVATVLMLALGAGSASAAGCLTDYTGPTASFDYSPGTPAAGSPVSFDATDSTPGSFTSYSYDAQADDCVYADSGSVAISSYSWNWGDGTANTTGTATPQHTFANPGTYTVVLTVVAGSAGRDSTSSTIKTSWTVAVTSPTVSSNPVLNYKRGALTLTATAAGPEEVKRVEFYVRNVKVGEDTTAPYSTSFNSATVADGAAAIHARAVGTSDTAANSPTKTVTFDNTAPEFTILEGSPVVKPGQDRFLVRFTDDGWLYGNPLCWADSAEPVDWDYCVGGGVEKTFEGAYTFALPEGQHTVYFRAGDAAGNQTTGSAEVTVDGTAPDTTIAAGDFALGSNEQGATFKCRVHPDGGAAPAFGSCPAAMSGLAPGAYRYEAVAVDAAGNEDPTPAVRAFTVSAPPAGGGQSGGPQQQQGGAQQGGAQQGGTTVNSPGVVKTKPGKCSKLKGKKRARCVKKACAKLKKKTHGAKRYRACVKQVTRKK